MNRHIMIYEEVRRRVALNQVKGGKGLSKATSEWDLEGLQDDLHLSRTSMRDPLEACSQGAQHPAAVVS